MFISLMEGEDAVALKEKVVLLKQLFTDIIDNSAKFSHPERPLKIEISFVRKDDFLQIIIADDGVGFDMQYADQVFQILSV
ncbi:MAG: light-regulated signal transduction histidine kinase (bacteriophytochrome) [Spirosomataceae bacterium]|jgi:light-regulated signal transduction histidine kinase (bacteriophytochrome)